MRMSWLLCVLIGTLAWGQAAPSAAPPQPAQTPAAPAARPQAPADTSASVPANAVVLTITGVCAPQPRAAAAKGATAKPAAEKTNPADCKTTITKSEFEKLANALAPNPTPQQKKQLASVLPRYIALSNEAKKLGMDKTEQFSETVKFVKMQVLTNQLQRKLQEDAAKISDADLEKYYKENPQAYELYNVDRIFVPRTKQQVEAEAQNDEDKDDKLTEEQTRAKQEAEKAKAEESEKAMTKLAEDLRARAATGEDMAKLQKEAFEAAGMKIESPTVNLPNARRTGLPQGHAAVFDLKPGEVSQVISDNGGHYFYKMNGKTEMPLDQAKNEIRGKIQNDRMREKLEKLNTSFQSTPNEAYFGPGGAGPMPPPRLPHPRPGVPPASPGAQPQTPPPAAQPPAPQKN